MGLKIHKITATRAEGTLDGVIPCSFRIDGDTYAAEIDGGAWKHRSCGMTVPSIREMRAAIYNAIAAYRDASRFGQTA